MKKTLLAFLMGLLFLLPACSSDDDDNGNGNGNGNDEITIDESVLNQSIFADETSLSKGISFTTADAWTSSISEKNATKAADWISIDPDHGDAAGNYTINIVLENNLSGEDRIAEIKIHCGDSDVTITVTQKGEKKDGSTQKLISRIVYHDHEENDGHNYDEIYTFSYDAQGRVIYYTEYYGWEDETTVYDITYEANEIIVKEKDGDTFIHKLNDKGYVTTITSPLNPYQRVSFTYNNDYVQKISVTEGEDERYSYTREHYWENGNLITIEEKEGASVYTDTYTYSEHPNIYNIDLNWFVYDLFDPVLIFGWAGKKSKNLADTRSWPYENPDHLDTVRYEFDQDGYAKKVYITWDDSEALWMEITY